MKRKEMIMEIEKYLDAEIVGDNSGYLYSNTWSEEILDLIEKLGMLPPAIEVSKNNFGQSVKVHKWEE